MTGIQKTKFRNLIESEIHVLLGKMNTGQFPDPLLGHERIADENDRASDILEKDMELRFKDRDRVRLNLLKDALSRVERGTYGICEECKGVIPEKRLELNVAASHCIGCQDRAEVSMGRRRNRPAGRFN